MDEHEGGARMRQARPKGRYANAFNVGYNAFEIVLDFAQLYADRQDAWVHSRIITAPSYAKLLLETLRESLVRYEKTYGAIPETGLAGDSHGSEPAGATAGLIDASGRTTMPEHPKKPRPDYSEPNRPPDYPTYPTTSGRPKGPPQQPPDYGAQPPPSSYGAPGGPPGYGVPQQPSPPGYAPPQQPPAYGTPPAQPPDYGTPGQPPGYAPPQQPPAYGTPLPQPPGYGAPGQPGYSTQTQQPTDDDKPTGYEPPTDYEKPTDQPTGYEAPTDQSTRYEPQAPTTYPPSPGQDYQLSPAPGYQPPPGQGYQPPPAQGYQPPPGQGYQPSPGQGYQPPPGQGYRPLPGQGYQQTPGEPTQPYGQKPQAECPKPSDQLGKLKAALDRQQAEITALTKHRESLQADVTGLETTVTDLDKTVSDYKAACKDLEQRKRDLDVYVATKTPMLDAAVKDKKPQIEQCIASIEAWIESWRTYAKHLEWAASEATKKATAAADKVQQEQSDYDALKNSAQQLDAHLKELKDLRDAIEQEDDKNKTANMYFLLKELRAALEKIRLRTPDELDHELCLAWTELNEAKAAARDAKAASDAAGDDSTAATKKYNDVVTNRRQTILDCISKLCAKAPPAKTPAY